MTHFWLLAILALAAGICVPTQAGINAQLSQWTRSPVAAATVSFAVGTLTLIVYMLANRLRLPPLNTIVHQPWWIWTGGALGAFFVATTVYLAPRLGATSMLALILAGQMTASLILDHYGWLGYPVQPINWERLVGVLLLVGGILLIRSN